MITTNFVCFAPTLMIATLTEAIVICLIGVGAEMNW